MCVALDDIVKVHVHTNHPGQAFEKALEYGQLTKMKVDNMREEHSQKVVAQSELQAAAAKEAMEKNSEVEEKKAEPAKDFGFITIAPGSGIAEIFKGLGVDEVIEGGQTMPRQYMFFLITVILFLQLIRQHQLLKIRSL